MIQISVCIFMRQLCHVPWCHARYLQALCFIHVFLSKLNGCIDGNHIPSPTTLSHLLSTISPNQFYINTKAVLSQAEPRDAAVNFDTYLPTIPPYFWGIPTGPDHPCRGLPEQKP